MTAFFLQSHLLILDDSRSLRIFLGAFVDAILRYHFFLLYDMSRKMRHSRSLPETPGRQKLVAEAIVGPLVDRKGQILSEFSDADLLMVSQERYVIILFEWDHL